MAKKNRIRSQVTRETIRERTPLSGEMGGTRDRTVTTTTDTTPRQSQWRNRGVPGMLRGRTMGEHALVGLFLVGVAIIAIRAIADYVPEDGGAEPGKEEPATGAHPLTMLAATLILYFVLSIITRMGRQAARVTIMFAVLIDLVLLMKSESEFQTVAGWFGSMRTGTRGPEEGSNSGSSGSSENTNSGSNSKQPPLVNPTPLED